MTTQEVNVGFVGLGRMGLPMTTRLVAAGFGVYTYDAAADARERTREVGAVPADDLAGLKPIDVLVTMLPNSDVVEAVLDEADAAGILVEGLVVVDMSSSEPARTRTLGDRLDGRGVRLVDAPVSGGVAGAEKGTLTIMAGGAADDVHEVRPVLGAMGKVVIAGGLGAGHAAKALNNLMSATHLWITSEALVAARRFGLEPEVVLDVVNGSSGRSGSTENKWPNFVLPGTYDSGFGLRLMLKDMRIAVDLARETGALHELGDRAVELWTRAAEALPESADHTEIARWIASSDEPTESGPPSVGL